MSQLYEVASFRQSEQMYPDTSIVKTASLGNFGDNPDTPYLTYCVRPYSGVLGILIARVELLSVQIITIIPENRPFVEYIVEGVAVDILSPLYSTYTIYNGPEIEGAVLYDSTEYCIKDGQFPAVT